MSAEPEVLDEFNTEDLSILAWVMKHQIVNEKGEPISYYDRMFLIDILTDWSPEIVIKKCGQIGGSVTFNLKVMFAVQKLGWNIIYTMPTDGDVAEFVSSKTNKIIQHNRAVFPGLDADSIERKELNGRFLFFKGTISKTAAISTTSDANVHDEASRSDQKILETYKSRLLASKYKRRWLFSNPTTEKDEIDIEWQKSDQKEWTVSCETCDHKQVLSWPESVDPVRKVYQCKKCKAPISDNARRLGDWVPQKPGNKISGYHISLLIAPWISAEKILSESEGDQEYFFNFILGEPYSPGNLRVSRATIIDCWTPRSLETGKYYLGVDVGNIKHYALGSEKGLIHIGRFSKWEELDTLMANYKPTLVIDANPDNTMARHYVEAYRNAYMSVFKENKDNPKTILWWGKGNAENDRQGIVYSNRNRILDQLIDEIVRARVLFGMASDREFREYLKHWDTLRRVKKIDTKGIESYEWDSTTGTDHYVFATLYWYLATLGAGNGVFFPEPARTEEKTLIGNDNVMGDISESIMSANRWDQ